MYFLCANMLLKFDTNSAIFLSPKLVRLLRSWSRLNRTNHDQNYSVFNFSTNRSILFSDDDWGDRFGSVWPKAQSYEVTVLESLGTKGILYTHSTICDTMLPKMLNDKCAYFREKRRCSFFLKKIMTSFVFPTSLKHRHSVFFFWKNDKVQFNVSYFQCHTAKLSWRIVHVTYRLVLTSFT